MTRLKEYREKANLSQRELARLSGVAQPFICRMETGWSEDIGLRVARRLVLGLNRAKVKCKLDDVFPPCVTDRK